MTLDIVDHMGIRSVQVPDQSGLESNLGVLPHEVVGDEVRLKQVLVNLTKHALKNSRDNPITIVASYQTENQTLSVRVKNEGKGFSREQLLEIETYFHNGQNELVIDSSLIFCKKIIDFYNGFITVSSEGSDRGSAFLVELMMISTNEADRSTTQSYRLKNDVEASMNVAQEDANLSQRKLLLSIEEEKKEYSGNLTLVDQSRFTNRSEKEKSMGRSKNTVKKLHRRAESQHTLRIEDIEILRQDTLSSDYSIELPELTKHVALEKFTTPLKEYASSKSSIKLSSGKPDKEVGFDAYSAQDNYEPQLFHGRDFESRLESQSNKISTGRFGNHTLIEEEVNKVVKQRQVLIVDNNLLCGTGLKQLLEIN